MTDELSFADKVRQQLEDWSYQLDRLEHRVADLSKEGGEKAKLSLADFRSRRDQLEARLKTLESASESAVEDLKDGIEIAWDGLKTGFYAARSEFEKDDD